MLDENRYAVKCPLCNETSTETISEVGHHGLPCTTVICPNDGMVYLSPRWSKERYKHFYEYEFDNYYRPTVFTEDNDDKKFDRARSAESRLNQFSDKLLENTNSVLDIGAGMGWILQYMQRCYPNIKRCYAIEPSIHCQNNIRDLGYQVVSADSENPIWDLNNKVDLIILRHVLEHFLDPLAVLKNIKQHLTADSYVYIAVPNMMNPNGSLNNYWFRCVHTYYFSTLTLNTLASLAGLKTVHMEEVGCEIWCVLCLNSEPVESINLDNNYCLQKQVLENYG